MQLIADRENKKDLLFLCLELWRLANLEGYGGGDIDITGMKLFFLHSTLLLGFRFAGEPGPPTYEKSEKKRGCFYSLFNSGAFKYYLEIVG